MATTSKKLKTITDAPVDRYRKYLDDNDYKSIPVAFPVKVHEALDAMVDRIKHEGKSGGEARLTVNKRWLISQACAVFNDRVWAYALPLADLETTRYGVDRRYTWYTPTDTYKLIRMLAAERGSSMRQLIVSAVLHHYADAPEFKDIDIRTNVKPSGRSPSRSDT